MIDTLLSHRGRLWLACALAGVLTPLSLSPFDAWPVGIVSVGLLSLFLCRYTSASMVSNQSYGRALLYSAFAFGLGYFGVGVSWVFVSIYYFGSTPLWLAVVMTALFIAFVAWVFALPFYTLRFIKPQWRLLIGFPLIWVVSEWLRIWVLTGFPWLFIGYSHIDTPLSGWASIGGVLLISLFSCFSSTTIAALFTKQHTVEIRLGAAALVISLWLGGAYLQGIQWTQASGDAISVGLVQPNIPQNLRWEPEFEDEIKSRLNTLSEPLWGMDWIIWPEGALPHLYHHSLDFVEETRLKAEASQSTVISGVLFDDRSDPKRTHYYNSMMAFGDAEGIYHKQRLVPFGEYVPLESIIRGLIDFFDLPLSVISPGLANQSNLRIGAYSLANAICYEIAYPALVAEQARNADVLLTVSNDAWFGDSIGPIQHFQMVRMRALEIGRYVIRGTNNGISAVIRPDGSIQAESEQFVQTSLKSHVIPMQGETPYMVWGNYLVLGLLLLVAGGAISFRRN